MYSKDEIQRPMHKPMDKNDEIFIRALTTEAEGDPVKAVQLIANVTPEKAEQIARRLMRKQDVRKILQLYAIGAVHRVEVLAKTARSEKVKLDANLGILDRAGFTPPKEQHTHNTLVIQIPEALAKKNGITATARDITPA